MPERNLAFVYPWEHKRPGMISLISVLVFLACLFHLLQFIQVLLQWDILSSLGLTLSPIYILLDGLIWSLLAGFLSWSFWTGKPWSPVLGKIIGLVYLAGFWIESIWIAEPAGLSTRWPLNLFLSLLCIGGFWRILSRHSSQAYFSRNPVKIS